MGMQFRFDEQSVRRIVQNVLRGEREHRNITNDPVARFPRRGENFRLIRGRSVGNQSGQFIVIDNVQVLSGGLDPSQADSMAQVAIANHIFPRVFVDDQWVHAVYSPDLGTTTGTYTEWETLETGSAGTETFRVARGLTKGTVGPGGTWFVIDNVIPLSGGLDPVMGDSDAELKVEKLQSEEFADNTPVCVLYEPAGTAGTGINWELLLSERYRLIRGVYVDDAAFNILRINNVDVLASGIDPRQVVSSPGEIVLVRVIDTASFNLTPGDFVYAAYNREVDKLGTSPVDWEWVPKGGEPEEKFRLIRGVVVGTGSGAAVGADDDTFFISNVVALANGLDPTSGNPATEIKIEKRLKEEIPPNAEVTAIYEAVGTAGTGAEWELLLVERHRIIRGDFVGINDADNTVIKINNIEVLSSGVDPRENPLDENEIVLVKLTDESAFTGTFGDKVYAAYNRTVAEDGGESIDWESLPRKGLNVVRGTTNAVVLTTASTFQIENLQSISGYAPGDPLTVSNIFGNGYALGVTIVAMKAANGVWVDITPNYGVVLADPSDTFPETLFSKLVNQGAFQTDMHQDVYAQVIAANLGEHGPPIPRNLIRLFTMAGTGTGTGDTNIVQGDVVGNVSNTDATFQIDNLVAVLGMLPGEPLTVQNIFSSGYPAGTVVLAILSASGEWIDATPNYGLVLANDTDTFPESLFSKLKNQATFTPGSHQEVYAEVVAATAGSPLPRNLVRLFTELGTGTGTGVELACGLEFTEDGKIKFKPSDVAGTGLGATTGTDECKLYVKIGCGLEIDESGNIRVKVEDLNPGGDCPLDFPGVGTGTGAGTCEIIEVGDGLIIEGGELKFKSVDAAGAGLSGQTHILSVVNGTGIGIAPGTGGGLFVNTGTGVTTTGTGVTLHAVNLDRTEGVQYYGHQSGTYGWITPSASGGDTVAEGNGINITGADPKVISVDAGDGLGFFGSTLVVNAGFGLGISAGNLQVDTGHGLQISVDQVIVKPSDFAGAGLTSDASTVKLSQTNFDGGAGVTQFYGHVAGVYQWLASAGGGDTVAAGCGITITGTTTKTIAVDAATLAGAGIVVSATCTLDVNPGDGIQILTDQVAVKPGDFAGAGLVLSGGDLSVNPGDGIEIVADAVAVKATDFAGAGLTVTTNDLNVNPGDGIEIVADAVAVKASDIAGNGLTATANNLNVTPNVTVNSVTGVSLTVSGTTVTVTINYTPYSVYGSAGTPATFTGNHIATAC